MLKIALVATSAIAGLHFTSGNTAVPLIETNVGRQTNCNITIVEEDVTKQCGYKARPCFVTVVDDAAGAPETLCNKKFIGAARNSVGGVNQIYFEVQQLDQTGTQRAWALSQHAWQKVCPFQCKGDKSCVNDPDDCKTAGGIVEDFVVNNRRIPGAAFTGVEARQMQWKSLNDEWNPDGVDDSREDDIIDLANPPEFDRDQLSPVRLTKDSRACPSSVGITPQDIIDKTCGATKENPCVIAGRSPGCNKCFNVTAIYPGLNENGSGVGMCKSGNCPAYWVEKHVILAYTPENQVYQAPLGMWAAPDACQYVCHDPTTGFEVCVRNGSDCLKTLLQHENVAADGDWPAYVENGSMKKSEGVFFLMEDEECYKPSNSASRAVASVGLTAFLFAALFTF